MITAVDSNVLLNVLGGDPTFGARSRETLRMALGEGNLIACDVVWAEVAAWFPDAAGASAAFRRLGVEYSPMDEATALTAGSAWKRYRQSGGPRRRIVGDFLVGAHAVIQAERLLTRDRGFYRAHFETLDILDPGAGEPQL